MSLRSSIGKKFLMGLTGLGLSLFLLTHMAGNMLIFLGPEAYNEYSHALITNHLIYLAEAGLLAMVVIHTLCAIKLTAENRAARPTAYVVGPSGDKEASAASKSMIYTGTLVLVFIILHLATFKYGHYYTATYNGVEMRDLHRLVLEVFQSPGYVAWYVVALLLLGVHLSHGFQSAFNSLGIRHPVYTPIIKATGWVYTVVVIAGFISQPLYVLLHR